MRRIQNIPRISCHMPSYVLTEFQFPFPERRLISKNSITVLLYFIATDIFPIFNAAFHEGIWAEMAIMATSS
jgi:hypothetical protein